MKGMRKLAATIAMLSTLCLGILDGCHRDDGPAPAPTYPNPTTGVYSCSVTTGQCTTS